MDGVWAPVVVFVQGLVTDSDLPPCNLSMRVLFLLLFLTDDRKPPGRVEPCGVPIADFSSNALTGKFRLGIF